MFDYYSIVWRLAYEENIIILTQRLVVKLINNCCEVFSVVCEDTCQWVYS